MTPSVLMDWPAYQELRKALKVDGSGRPSTEENQKRCRISFQ